MFRAFLVSRSARPLRQGRKRVSEETVWETVSSQALRRAREHLADSRAEGVNQLSDS